MNRYDFLVVGGGPVGCRTGALLAAAGHQVAVLEKSPSVGAPVCCTGIVSRECLKRFGIPGELVLQELNSATAFSPQGKTLHIERPGVQATVIDRGAYNAHLARQAQEAGADYLLGHHVSGVVINPDGIVAEAERGGQKRFFEARALVLACGFGSRLPEKLGLGGARERVAGAQVEVDAPDLREVQIYAGCRIAPGFFAWLVPAGVSGALAGLMTRQNASVRLAEFLSLLEVQGRIKAATGKASYRGITLQGPAKTCATKVVAVGDAAGQVKPLTGGGLYFGLLCADIAAGTLHAAMETGDFSAGGLSSYEKEWKRLLGRELRLARLAHRLYAKLSDQRVEWLMDMAKKKKLDEALARSNAVNFDWHGSAMLQVVKEILWPFNRMQRPEMHGNNPVEV